MPSPAELGAAVGTAVVHFLWQGTLLGLLGAGLLRGLRRGAPELRGLVALGALVACLGAFGATTLVALRDVPAPSLLDPTLALAGSRPAAGRVAPELLVACLWSAGVLVLGLRALGQVRSARRLKRAAVAAPGARWLELFDGLRVELGIRRSVRLLASGLAEVPMVVGWLSPVVLVPVAVLARLTPDQVRALLIHELAHVRRHDHVLNAVQAAIEILLFFHPAVWWLSRQVRVEREYCCDDSAVRLTGDPRLLARALAALEELRVATPTIRTALAADGGSLMQRITRLLGAPTARRSPSGPALSSSLVVAGLLALAGSAYAARGLGTSTAADPQEGVLRREVKEEPAGDALQEARSALVELKRHMEEVQGRIERGELSAEEGRKLLSGLRARHHMTQLRLELAAAVQVGSLSREEAKAKLAARSRELEERLAADRSAELELVTAKIRAAVAAGELSPEEGRAKLQIYREKRTAKNLLQKRESPEAAVQRILAAVEAGELTPELAREKLAHARGQAAAKLPADPKGQVARIQEALESGAITVEEARARLAALRAELAARLEARTRREALMREVEAQLAAGRITKAEAKAKLEAVERARGRLHSAEGEAAVQRILAAVEAGQLTPEQGELALEKLRRLEAERQAVERQAAEEAAVSEKRSLLRKSGGDR